MKKTFLLASMLLVAGTVTFTSCSKKAKEETKEATEAVKEDVKDAASDTGDAIKDAASDVKDAAKETASDIKDATHEAVAAVDSRVSKLDNSARIQYDAFDKEITRLDGEISRASASEKVKLEKTRAAFVRKRDELLK
jgi:uncharacterized protein YjbJ (UPF0337 family)